MADSQIIKAVNVEGNLSARDISVVMGSHHIVNANTYILTEPRDPAPPKKITFNVEKPIQTFTGRESFLLDLHRVVKKGQVTVLTQIPFAVVAATGGIGKTETVRMYIQLHAHEYDHVIWIDAEVNSSAKNQFIQLGIELGISTDFEGKLKEFGLIKKQIFEKLLQHNNVVLLVLNNAEVFEDDKDQNLCGIKNLLPTSMSSLCAEPTVIVTSRNQNWNLQKVIHLDLWSEAEVVVFVVKRLELQETPENKELATDLGNIFGCLPIALQAAVAVILQQIKRRKKYGIQNLIHEYESGSRRVFAQKLLDSNMRPTQTSIPMMVLWNVSLEKIVKFPDGKLAVKILCLMAYLSPTRIPQDFLYALFQNHCSQDSFENGLEILENYSLISSLLSADSNSHSFSIHRMIQHATIENLRTTDRQKSLIIFSTNTFLNEAKVLMKLSIGSINYIETLDTRVLPRGSEIVKNLVHITSHVSQNLDVKEFRDLTAKVAGVLRFTNDFAKSIELYERVHKATPASKVESEILEKIRLKWNLAAGYGDRGFHQKSIELFAEVLEDETRALGSHHEDTLETKCVIANTLRLLGKYNEAAEKFSEVLQDFRNIQDTSSETFLRTKHSYAPLLKVQEKTEDAFQLLTEVLEEYDKNPDLNSDGIIITKGNIANLLGNQGKLEEASAMMQQNISDATRVFGPFHLKTFAFKRNYAHLLFEHGKHEEAAQFLLELLEIKKTELGSEHPSTLLTMDILAALYMSTQEPDKALPLLYVQVYERVFGPEHPETMMAANNLGILIFKQGKLREALSLHNNVLKTRTQVLGPNHSDTLATMVSIVCVHYAMKEFNEAVKMLPDQLLREEEVLGKDHPNTINTLEFHTDCRKILDKRNDLIVNFVTLTSVDAETGRSLLEASNWNIETALDTFFKSKSPRDKRKKCVML